MANGDDYSGAIESAKQLKRLMGKAYRFYVGEQIPKDPQAVIDMAKRVKREESLRSEAEIARDYIKRTWSERRKKERAARRAKLRKIFRMHPKG